MSLTLLIIAFTTLFSIWAFQNPDVLYKCRHWPYAEARHGEYYRWLTGGFLHGDYMHLLFNMLTLYFFGEGVEQWFSALFPGAGQTLYLLFYLTSIVAASLATFYKYRDVEYFASIGASGAVSAVLFAAILIMPTMSIRFFILPGIGIPGFVYGIVFLWYSDRAARTGGDGIDHLAHFYGAVFGFLFPLVLKPVLLIGFFGQLALWFSSFGN